MQTAFSKETLSIYFLTGSQSKSVSVFDSDAIGNLLHMEALVATLVKYGNSGEYVPSLASSWIENEKKTIFRFNFKSQYFDESGDQITPLKFSKCLHLLLKEYSKKSDPPVFSNLIGWDDFKNGKRSIISGVIADEKFIEFRFSSSISGLLEFLSMPYYGYYNQANFNSDGTWKDNKKIISSGEYYLNNFSNDSISLSLRNQSSAPENSQFTNITIYSKSENQKNFSEDIIGPNLIILDSKTEVSVNEGETIKPTPTILAMVEINSRSATFQKNKYLKEQLYQHLTGIRKKYILESDFITPTEGFFKKISASNYSQSNSILEKTKIRIHKISSAKSSAYLYLLELIKTHLEKGLNIETEFYSAPPKQTIMERNAPDQNYEIRIKIVDIGYRAENWVLKMMFCSNLGVTLEDPSGDICKLTKDFENGNYLNHSDFEDEFEKIILKDKSIVPFFKTGFKFIYSKSVDPLSLSQTTNVPRIDMLRKK